jgi:hypothetical protein
LLVLLPNYFPIFYSIPLQLVASLTFYPRLMQMPPAILALFILFALFILCCGTGHVLRCVNMMDTQVFYIVNRITAVVSIVTAVVLLPMVPSLMSSVDEGLERLQRLEEASKGVSLAKYSALHGAPEATEDDVV